MHLMGIDVRYRGGVPGTPLLKKGQWNELLKVAWFLTGMLWGTEMRPKHFTKEGARQYGYTPRAGDKDTGKAFWRSYQGKKQKKWGHTLPLVWSGDSRAASERFQVRTTRDSARVVMHCPALNFRNLQSQINMADELTSYTPAEEERLRKYFENQVHQRLQELENRQETKHAV